MQERSRTMEIPQKMIKVALVVLMLFLVVCSSASVFASPEGSPRMVKVFIDEKPLVMDVSPVIVHDRTFVPMRAIFEALGAELVWDGLEQSVVARSGEITIQLWIGRTDALVNGKGVTLDAAPFILESRTMVPLRFVSEAMERQVQWDGVERIVSITSRSSGRSNGGLGAHVEWEPEPDPAAPLIPKETLLPVPPKRNYTLTLRPASLILQQGEVVTFDGYLMYTTDLTSIPSPGAGKEIKIFHVLETGTGTYHAVLGNMITDSQGYFYYKYVPSVSAAYYVLYDDGSGQGPVISDPSEVTVEEKAPAFFIPLPRNLK